MASGPVANGLPPIGRMIVGRASRLTGWSALFLIASLWIQSDAALVGHPYPAPPYGPDVPIRGLLDELGVSLVEGGWLPDAAIIIVKSERKLYLKAGAKLVKSYRVQLGPDPDGPKLSARDGRTPEGSYRVCRHNPNSRYYLSLQIDYPSAEDVVRGLASGLVSSRDADRLAGIAARGEVPPGNTPLGGDIFIHGQHPKMTEAMVKSPAADPSRRDLLAGDVDPASQDLCYDWTLGCVAMANPDIRELYGLVRNGTPVTIRP